MLLGQLYQVVHMHKGSPFNPAQTDLLRRVAQRIGEKAAAPGSFEYFEDDIICGVKGFLAEMEAHGS